MRRRRSQLHSRQNDEELEVWSSSFRHRHQPRLQATLFLLPSWDTKTSGDRIRRATARARAAAVRAHRASVSFASTDSIYAGVASRRTRTTSASTNIVDFVATLQAQGALQDACSLRSRPNARCAPRRSVGLPYRFRNDLFVCRTPE